MFKVTDFYLGGLILGKDKLLGRFSLQVTGHLLAVSSYRGLLAVSFYSGLLTVSFHSSLLALSFYLLLRATVTCDL